MNKMDEIYLALIKYPEGTPLSIRRDSHDFLEYLTRLSGSKNRHEFFDCQTEFGPDSIIVFSKYADVKRFLSRYVDLVKKNHDFGMPHGLIPIINEIIPHSTLKKRMEEHPDDITKVLLQPLYQE